MRRAAVVVALALAAAPAPTAAGPYAADARAAYVGRALDGVRRLGTAARGALEEELYAGARNRCRAGLGVPPLSCLLAVARDACARRPEQGPACALVADVIVTNQLAEPGLVTEGERMKILASAADYRAAMRAELSRRYAALAADLALAEPGTEAELPARIDRFCAGRERPLAWQRCVAALVWHIGTHEGGARP